MEVLASIFGGRDELEVISRDPTTILVLRLESTKEVAKVTVPFDLTVEVGKDYPDSTRPSAVITSSGLSNSACADLKNDLSRFITNELDLGSPVILDIASWCQRNVCEYARDEPEQRTEVETKSTKVTIIEIDHMRERRAYCKLLESWASEVGLTGRILFIGKSAKPKILVFLESEESKNLGEFVKRLGTVKVDVDSQGRPCKEKMKNVICSEVNIGMGERAFNDFGVELTEELAVFVERYGLCELFMKYKLV